MRIGNENIELSLKKNYIVVCQVLYFICASKLPNFGGEK